MTVEPIKICIRLGKPNEAMMDIYRWEIKDNDVILVAMNAVYWESLYSVLYRIPRADSGRTIAAASLVAL